MSPETERIIRESWRRIEPESLRFSELFYARLFEMDREVRALFANTDADEQHQKFAQMLGGLIGSLDDPRRLVRELAAAGRRHVDYGVCDRDYDTVGTALLDVLAETLGDGFSAELRDAWRETYDLLAAVMRRGAARAREENRAGSTDVESSPSTGA